MMPRRARTLVLAALSGCLAAGCAQRDEQLVDPEAQMLDPPVVIIEEPPPEEEPQSDEGEAGVPPAMLVKNPDTEVITFAGEDADPGMADEITGSPKRESLPSMMSDIIKGPNK